MFQGVKQKKYLIKLFRGFLCSAMLLLALTGAVLYKKMEKQVELSTVREKTKILQQFDVVYKYMDQFYAKLCASIYYSPEISALLFDEKMTYEKAMATINNLQRSLINVYPSLDSVYVYNAGSKQVFTTKTLGYRENDPLAGFIVRSAGRPLKNPVLIEPPDIQARSGSSEVLLSYIVNDSPDPINSSILAVNFSASWVIDFLKQNNQDIQQNGGSIFFVSPGGAVTGGSDPAADIKAKRLISGLTELPASGGGRAGCCMTEADNEKCMVFYTSLDTAGRVVLVQKYDVVFRELHEMRNAFIILLVLFAAAATGLSWGLSTMAYSPVGKLMRSLQSGGAVSAQYGDELEYIAERYSSMEKQLQSDSELRARLMARYHLQGLLSCSNDEAVKAFKAATPEHWLFSSGGMRFAVLLFQLELVAQDALPETPAAETLTNTALEYFKEASAVYLQNNKYAVLAGAYGQPDIDAAADGMRSELLLESGACFSVAYGALFDSPEDISAQYENAGYWMRYSFVFGHGSVLSKQRCRRNEEAALDKAALKKSCERLAAEINAGNAENARAKLDKLFADIASVRITDTLAAVTELLFSIINAADNIGAYRTGGAKLDFDAVYKDVFAKNTLDEAKKAIDDLMDSFFRNEGLEDDEKDRALGAAVREYVEKRYSDPALCIQSIAGALRISNVRYLSRCFKSVAHTSVSDYLTGIRLKHAAELLLNTSGTVSEISEKIGIENSNYFYTLFKKKYGLTPRDFALLGRTREIS